MATTWTDKGGYLAFDRLSAKLRYATQQMSPMLRFVRDEPKLGGNKGDTVNITKIYNPTREYPTTPLDESAPIPENDWTQGQVSLVLDEWGDSFPLTEKFVTLADFDPSEITTTQLMNSMKKNQNYLIAQEMKKTAMKYSPISGTTTTIGSTTSTVTSGTAFNLQIDGTNGANFSRAIGVADLHNLRNLALQDYRLPPLSGEISEFAQYGMLCSQYVISQLLQDTTIAAALNYSYMGSGNGNPLLKGSLGVYNGIVFYLDTQNFSGTQDGYTGEAVFFGDDTVVSGTAIYPEIRRKQGQDYGRDPGVAWYGLYNYKLVGGATSAEVSAYHARCIHLSTTANAVTG